MDITQPINCIEWCFGYGGNHLGIKRVIPSLRCIAASEIEGYAVANVVAKIEAGCLDAFPLWTDAKTFPCEEFHGLVDLFIASYPCQGFSSAGQRKGADDPRHLWPYVRRAVEIIQPRLCFFENVEGHISLGLREVLTELALLGYRVENSGGEPTWGIFSAAEHGAPQNRKRVFILAERQEQRSMGNDLREQIDWDIARGFFRDVDRASEELGNTKSARNGTVSARPGNERIRTPEPDRPSERLADTASIGERERQDVGGGSGGGRAAAQGIGPPRGFAGDSQGWQESHGSVAELRPLHWPAFAARPGEQQHGWEPPRIIGVKRGLGGGVNGRALSMDEYRRTILKHENMPSMRETNSYKGQEPCEILRTEMLHSSSNDEKSKQSDNQETCAESKSSDGEMRNVRIDGQIAETSPGLQPADKSSNPLQRLPLEDSWRRDFKTNEGKAHNVDRLRLLGNGVYPAAAATAFYTLYRRLTE